MTLYVTCNNAIYFDCFGSAYILKEIKKLIGNKNITTIYRIQAYDLVMYQYFCIGLISFMFKGKSLICFKYLLL